MSALDQMRLARIAPWMQTYVDSGRYAGSSVLIKQHGEEIYFHACGQRDIDANLPFTRDTVARIYSMTKPVTSLALMMLVERGIVHLDAPVSDFIAGFADTQALIPGATSLDQTRPCAAPTLHQLLTHTSGLSYSFNPGLLPAAMEEAKLMFGPGSKTLAEASAETAALPLAFEPGKRWEYSVGIDIIGRVIEVITGRSLDEFISREVLAPLGMTETGFRVPEAHKDRFATLYTPLAEGSFTLDASSAGGALRVMDHRDKSPFYSTQMFSGGGGLVGTLDDYMRFVEALRSGGQGLVSPGTLSFMMSNHLAGDITSMGTSSFAEQPMDGMGFGLGGSVVLDPARTGVPGNVGDFSWGGMASTFFWTDPVLDLSVVFFTQLLPSSTYPARAQLKALIHGAVT